MWKKHCLFYEYIYYEDNKIEKVSIYLKWMVYGNNIFQKCIIMTRRKEREIEYMIIIIVRLLIKSLEKCREDGLGCSFIVHCSCTSN